jgi:2-polyprenyl-3-methyl-5-hydroxy-6-metoxy-1,4-benzoquinol methylase
VGSEQPENYYNLKMSQYNKRGDRFYNIVYNKIIELLPQEKNIKILDVGCGRGTFIGILLSNNYSNICGIDFSEWCINYCRNKFDSIPFIKINLKNILCFKLIIENFSIIISTEVMEHILDDISIIKAIPKDHIFIFSVPNFDNEGHVRWFNNIDEIKNRYEKFLKIEESFEFKLFEKKENTQKIFLIKSRKI